MPITRNSRLHLVFALLILTLMVVFGPAASGALAETPNAPANQERQKEEPPAPIGEREKGTPYSELRPTVSRAVRSDVSPPLRSMTIIPPVAGPPREFPERAAGVGVPVNKGYDLDPVVQSILGPLVMPAPLITFEGTNNVNGVAPPDTVGDVGPNHYVQMVNVTFEIFTKSGASIFGPANINTLWQGFGGDCETDNAGDPIVLHDQLADRWLLTQFTSSGPTFFNCVAISTGPDPAGSYTRYAFQSNTGAGSSNFPDYPKYGVWPDAYYISSREFDASPVGPFEGMGAYALNRAQMLVGNPAPAVIQFLVTPGGTPYNLGDGLLPSDLDGDTLPPAGAPNVYVGSMDNGGPYGAPQDALTLWRFHVDWVTPANSTFTLNNTIPIAAYDTIFPCSPGSRNCIPQPGTTNKVDILSYRQRPMHRAAYRNYGTHEAIVTNQSVEATAGVAGIRWWEIRNPAAAPVLFQDATFNPADGVHRWMGSAAMDRKGNMALGYSVSNATTVFPGIRYAGRLATDPVNTLAQGEAVLINGAGSQTSAARWGDYSSMNVDPTDDCTFWYTTEYYQVSSAQGWQNRIGAFRFPECKPAVCGAGGDYAINSSTSGFVTGATEVGVGCDDCITTVALPFSVRFYGETFTSINVSSNGNAQFNSSNADWVNACLPNSLFNNAIFPFWDDLLTIDDPVCPSGNCGIFTSFSGTAGQRVFNIEWRTRRLGTTTSVRFTLRLFEGEEKVEFIYADVYQNGASATIGMQKEAGILSTSYSCNSGSVAPGLKLTFRPRPCQGGCESDYDVASATGGFVAGTALVAGSQCDDCVMNIALPFTYYLYGQPVTLATASSNGNLQFTSLNAALLNECLPTNALNDAILPFWDDIDMRTSITTTFTPGVYTSISGVAPNRIFNIEWRACLYNSGLCNRGRANFEVRLFEGQDRFEFVYGTVADGGAGATVGVQRGTGQQFTSFSCNLATLAANQRLIFTLGSGTTATGSIVASDPVQTGRLFRDGTASTCPAPKACPGPFGDSNPRHYDAYSYVNNSSITQCVTVDLRQDCGGNEIFGAAYLNGFNPGDLCLNYLADAGASATTRPYSFNVPAGARYVVVVHEVDPNAGCSNYSLTVSTTDCTPKITPTVLPTYTQTRTPTNTPSPTNTLTATNTPTITPTCVGGLSYKILIVYADGTAPTALQSQLLAEPGVGQVNTFDARFATPSLAELLQYDQVVAFSNSSWNNAVAMGDVLADYQDAGGVVVVATFAYDNRGGWLLQGRWMTGGYSPYVDTNVTDFVSRTLGVFDGDHPLMQGVSALASTLRNGVTLAPGATQVAAYNNGTPLLATKKVSGRAAVGINGYLGGTGTGFSGHWARLIVNTLRWLKPIGGQNYDILLVYADAPAPTDLRAQLLADPDVGTVDLFDARVNTPSLGQLLLYDEVVAWSNNSWGDPVAMGDVLADYQDADGVVVVADFSFYGPSSAQLQGRWMTGGYSPYTTSTVTDFVSRTLGLADTDHPLMQGVTALESFYRVGVGYTADAIRVAEYNNGAPLLATKKVSGRHAVAINAYLGNGPVRFSGDWARIIVNAARWLGFQPCPATPTPTPTFTFTSTPTNTPTNTPTSTPIPPTNTPTNTATNTRTNTPIPPTNTPTTTATSTPTSTRTNTATNTRTNTPVPPTSTATNTPTNTPTVGTILVGHVVWQGPPAQPHANQQLPLTLTLKSGSMEVNYPPQNTDASGFFSVSVAALPDGTYNWRVKGPNGGGASLDAGYLANSGVLTKTSASQINVEMGLLRAGDANNDNLVSAVDFNILRAAFGTSGDLRADWNNDGLVSAIDFNLLRLNFGTGGSPPLGPGSGKAEGPPFRRGDK